MDNYIAVCVELENKQHRYFLTFGRIFDPVNGDKLCEIILHYASRYALGGVPKKAQICYSLNDASHAPYFYECLMQLYEFKCPVDKRKMKKWKSEMKKMILKGEMIMYCGDPDHRESCRNKFWSMKSTDQQG